MGKVFEKINGYKDGAVFTPGFITMYMCRESIRRAITSKFNLYYKTDESKDKFASYLDVCNFCRSQNDSSQLKVLNSIIDDIKICDPAVGSGHFLVSALNEIIAIKHDLRILCDDNGSRVVDYEITVANDELQIVDNYGATAEYRIVNNRPATAKIEVLWRTLFEEKRKIIEKCLFGVDINSKSVLICRLRLWIELLKHAYYKAPDYKELETLPNIDINIKCGNSLISRYELASSLEEALGRGRVSDYRNQVGAYKQTSDKKVKRDIEQRISEIKGDFVTVILARDPKVVALSKKKRELNEKHGDNMLELFETPEQREVRMAARQVLVNDIDKLEKALKAVRENAVYSAAFEWRFEFPEVLSENGEYVGFDIVIGNPPYMKENKNRMAFDGLKSMECYQGKMDLWYLFGELGLRLLSPGGLLCFIATNNWTTNRGAERFRNYLLSNSRILQLVDFGQYMIFDHASIQTMVMLADKVKMSSDYQISYWRLNNNVDMSADLVSVLSTDKGVTPFTHLTPTISPKRMQGQTLSFNHQDAESVLDKISAAANVQLHGKTISKKRIVAEVAQGVVMPQDTVSGEAAAKLGGRAEKGEGIFLLSTDEYLRLNLSDREKEIVKPFYTSKQIHRYYVDSPSDRWLIYTQSNINDEDDTGTQRVIDSYPNIKRHLDRFQDVITSDNKPYGLHRARVKALFEGDKILCLRKCAN